MKEQKTECPLCGKPKTELIYLASPYTHPDKGVMQARFEAVCMAAGQLMIEGRNVFSPIAHSHPIGELIGCQTDWEFWKKQDMAILERSTEVMVLILDGWKKSVGWGRRWRRRIGWGFR